MLTRGRWSAQPAHEAVSRGEYRGRGVGLLLNTMYFPLLCCLSSHPLELLLEDVRRHQRPLERVEPQTARVVLVVPLFDRPSRFCCRIWGGARLGSTSSHTV